MELRTDLSQTRARLAGLTREVEQAKLEAEDKKRARDAALELLNLDDAKRDNLPAQKELDAAVVELLARVSVLEKTREEHLNELPRLKALVPNDFKIEQHSIEVSTPAQKDSSKRAVYFECVDDRVNPFFGRYVRKYYVVRQVGSNSIVIRYRPGETLAETRLSTSDWRVETLKLDSKKEYVALVVRPSGFRIFLQLRKQLQKNGIDVGWEPLEAGAVNMASPAQQFRGRFRLQ
ncbi:hypothetical protein J7M28_12760 [bacterium]|nr:hypothetical protein [bacterium]